MTTVARYALQRAIYDYLNPKGTEGTGLPLERETVRARYDLTEPELEALLAADIAALYRLGVHPVLLNSFARARVPRDRYRAALAELASAERG
jgi:hypothetical protein